MKTFLRTFIQSSIQTMISVLAAFGGGALRLKYFLELTTREGEFVVHHEKLIEYGVMTSIKSNHVKVKLDALELVENEDYSELPDIRQNLSFGGREVLPDIWQNLSFGGRPKKVYMLTPEAFKNCLIRFGYS